MDHAVEDLAPLGKFPAEPGDLVLVLHVADVDPLPGQATWPRCAHHVILYDVHALAPASSSRRLMCQATLLRLATPKIRIDLSPSWRKSIWESRQNKRCRRLACETLQAGRLCHSTSPWCGTLGLCGFTVIVCRGAKITMSMSSLGFDSSIVAVIRPMETSSGMHEIAPFAHFLSYPTRR